MSIDRGTLREILAAGLDDRIHYGRELAGYEQDTVAVTLRFADGSAESAASGAEPPEDGVRLDILKTIYQIDRTDQGVTLSPDRASPPGHTPAAMPLPRRT
jgi:hypothetical protein